MLKNIQRVLFVKKTSRLAYERMRASCNNDNLLAQELAEQGSDYSGLLQRHLNHENNCAIILKRLKSRAITVIVRDRDNINPSDPEHSDIVIAAGGDGNFLTASSNVYTSNHMVVGINTDPERSEGHLCITPTDSYSIEQIVDDILNNKLKSINRQRIRALLNGRSLPVLSLNEVFIGDCDPSQACYFELSCDDGPSEKIRCSGLIIYTGTGSTSWAYNARKVYTVQVSRILSTAERFGSINNDSRLQEVATAVTRLYNEELLFPGNEMKMGCVIREPIKRGSTNGFLIDPARYCKRLKVKSRSFDNRMIIDSHHQYKFPNGLEAEFHINPQDALLTMTDSKSTIDNR